MRSKKEPELVTQRAYALKLKTSHTNIQNAIATGKIAKGYDKETKKINVEIADKEFGNDFVNLRVNNLASSEPGSGNSEIILDGTNSLSEARRKHEILKAQLVKVEIDERMGILVNRSEVQKQLVVAGIETRKMIERFPMTVIDGVLGAKTRGEALRVMEEGIYTMLTQLGTAIETALRNPK